MNSLEINKICAAVLVAGIAFAGSGLIGEALIHPRKLETSAIKIDLPESKVASATPAAPEPSIAVLLASADAGRGEVGIKAQGCVACHSLNEGGKAGIGPNLYGVIGAPHGHQEGFAYSAVLKAKQGPWTFEAMNEWLRKPNAYAPGTKMTYAGLTDPKKRADIIEYLRTLSATPQPKPEAPVQAAAASVPSAAATASPGPGPTDGGLAQAAAPIGVRLASANVGAGQASTLKLACIACHSFNEGGKSGIGPNLYGVVGQPVAHREGYAYSAALKGKAVSWSYGELDKWLVKPAAYAPGTKMTFAGVADPKVRADIIAYLRSLAATPEPLPQ